MPVHEHHTGRGGVGGAGEFDDRQREDVTAQRQCARETRVLPARAVGQRRGDEDIGQPSGQRVRECPRDPRVSLQRQVRTVLLGAP